MFGLKSEEKPKKKKKNTPGSKDKALISPNAGGTPHDWNISDVSFYAYEMHGHAKQTVERYLKLAHKKVESELRPLA